MNQKNIKKLSTIAVLCALAYIVMIVGRIPIVLFLKYDPKDVVLAIGGFLFGPMAAFAMSLVVSLLEMLTASDTGLIGLFMNVLASASFACTAAIIYKKMHTMRGAVIGLASGVVVMTVLMIAWNFIITPIYLGIPRSAVTELLVPAILPFNIFKASLNMALTLLIYKPFRRILYRSRLLPKPEIAETSSKLNVGFLLASLMLLITCIVFGLVLSGVL